MDKRGRVLRGKEAHEEGFVLRVPTRLDEARAGRGDVQHLLAEVEELSTQMETVKAEHEETLSTSLHALENEWRQKLEALSHSLGRLVQSFTDERTEYFRALERFAFEVAMTTTKRVLKDECHTNPRIVLTAVRDQLHRLHETERVELVLNPADYELIQNLDLTQEFGGAEERITMRSSQEVGRGRGQIRSDMGTLKIGALDQVKVIEENIKEMTR